MRYWKLDAREGGKIISKKNKWNSAAADVEAATAFMIDDVTLGDSFICR